MSKLLNLFLMALYVLPSTVSALFIGYGLDQRNCAIYALITFFGLLIKWELNEYKTDILNEIHKKNENT